VTFWHYPSAVSSWETFLGGAEPHRHAVQIYCDVDDLAQSVAAYFSAGFQAGAPALLVATTAHEPHYRRQLESLGWDVEQLVSDGLLVTKDAEALLESIMRDGYPSSAAFDERVGGAIDELAERFPSVQLRVFGEMVDVLYRRGADEAAISLEELWNSLGWSRSFSLLCGYELDVFDPETQRSRLPEICRTHSHVKAAADVRRFARAVDGALEDVLGRDEAGKVYVVVANDAREESVPSPQRILMWVSEHMPSHAQRILAAARQRYNDQ
jgi:MEDS: MEthanogen/methylotroph, DcmR Sensory domain